jgi:hypothetical protein
MPDESLKGPQISEHKNPLPCKVGDKGIFSRHNQEYEAEVIQIFSSGLVDILYGQHDNGEPMTAVSIPVKLSRPLDGPIRWFCPGLTLSPGTAEKGKEDSASSTTSATAKKES